MKRTLLLSLALICSSVYTLAQTSRSADTVYLENIEINAVRAGEKTPVTQTTITGTELQKKNLGQDLPILLNEVPGVVVNSDAGNGVGYTQMRIRGTDATRINVTLNGIPYNDAESQGTFFVDLPDFAASTSSVQVQRGVGTSSNGAGAFGGSINLSTNKLQQQFYAGIESSGGSFNTWRHAFKVGSGLLNKHFTIDGRISSITSDGFIDRASSDLKSVFGSVAYLNTNNSLRINIFSGKEKTYQAWYGIAEADRINNRTYNSAGTEHPFKPYDNETDNYVQTHYQGFYNQKLSSNWNFQSAFFFTRGKGYYEQYKASAKLSAYGLQNVTGPQGLITRTDLIRRLYLDNDFYGTVMSAQYKKESNEYTIGGGLNRYNGKHYGIVTWAQAGIPDNYKWYDLRAYKTDFNIYGKMLQQISNKLFLFGDVQIRNVVYDIGGFRDNPTLQRHNKFNFINPKVGISWIKDGMKAYISYAQANKEPNREDFEANAAQQPVPEKLHDVEAGFQNNHKNFVYGVTLYYMNYDNQLVLTGKINDVGAYTRTNIKSSYRTGVELEAKALINSWLNVRGNICFSSNKINNFKEFYDDYDNGGQVQNDYSRTDIAYSPDVTAVAAINVLPLKNFSVDISNRYTGKQYLDNTSNENRKLDPFFVQDIMLSYSIKEKFFKECSFIFQVNNLLNEMYEPNGYTFSYIYGGRLNTENYYFPMAGRNFMAGVKVHL